MSRVVLKNVLIPSISVDPEIPPDIRAVIQETLRGIHGRNLCIRSIKPLESPECLSDWTTLGRAKLHASHNLRGIS